MNRRQVHYAILILGGSLLIGVYSSLDKNRNDPIARNEVSLEDQGRALHTLPGESIPVGELKSNAQNSLVGDSDNTRLSGKFENETASVAQEVDGSNQGASDFRHSLLERQTKDTDTGCAIDYPEDILVPPRWQASTRRQNGDPPRFWWESVPGTATVATDEAWEGSQSVYVKKSEQSVDLFLWQAVDALQLRNRRIEFSASVRNTRSGSRTLMFARTLTRESLWLPPAGSGAAAQGEYAFLGERWERHSILIDIPPNSDVLLFGFSGSDAWIDEVQMRVVGDSDGSRVVLIPRVMEWWPRTPISQEFILQRPENLDFEALGIPVEKAGAKELKGCKSER